MSFTILFKEIIFPQDYEELWQKHIDIHEEGGCVEIESNNK